MHVSPADLRSYEDFIGKRGRRADMNLDYVRLQITRLKGLIESGRLLKRPPPKMQFWLDQLSYFEGVENVMAQSAGAQSAGAQSAGAQSAETRREGEAVMSTAGGSTG